MLEHWNSVKQLKNVLSLYNKEAKANADGQLDVFSGGVKSKEDILKDVLQLLNITPQQQQSKLTPKTKQDNGTEAEQSKQPTTTAEQQPTEATEATRQPSQAEGTAQAGTAGKGREASEVAKPATDKQGNPLNADGSLKVDKIGAVEELTDGDFSAPTRNVQLPALPNNVDKAIGAGGKPVVIKKNIFEKNGKHHKDLTPEDSRNILSRVLYSPDLYGNNQKETRPYNWILVNLGEGGKHKAVILEVSNNKEHIEIVNWHYLDEKTLNRKKKQAVKEGGLILELSTDSSAADTFNDLSVGKDSKAFQENQEAGQEKFTPTPQKEGESVMDYAERVAGEHQAHVTRKKEEAKVNTNPTDAQKEAGNYRKGHIKIDGMDVTIEQPKGSVRRGTDADGKAWESKMHNTYGYIRGTQSVDGDHIDIFLSDNPESGNVYVVDQVNTDGTFDEHKVMYGFPDMESARKAYLSNYKDGWQGLGNITEVSKEEFKKWINGSKRKTKPFAEYSSVKTEGDVKVEHPIESSDGTETHQGGTEAESNQSNQKSSKKGNYSKYVLEEDAERFEELRRRLKKKLGGQLNLGIDPEVFAMGVEMSYLMLKKGARVFKEYAHGMIDALGDEVRPYLKSFYNGARDLPEMEDVASDLTAYEEVRNFDVATIGKESVINEPSIFDTAEQISKESKVEKIIEQEAKNTTESEDVDTPSYSITQQHNNKKDIDIWVVRGKERVERDAFLQQKQVAKDNNGYYSSFKGVNGFVFNTPEEAQAFANNAFSKADAAEVVAEKTQHTDNQGNPINEQGKLIVEKIESIDDLTDADFEQPTRSVELPTIPKNIDDAIGANGKPVVIKKNIFEKNKQSHSDLTPAQSRDILQSALYNADLYGQNQKARRPYNWIVINTKDNTGNNRLVLLEVNDKKDNVEIIHWHYIREAALETIKRQAEREGGLILILPSDYSEEAGGLSSRTPDLSSDVKDSKVLDTKQENLSEDDRANLSELSDFAVNTDSAKRTAVDAAGFDSEALTVPLLVDGKPSRLSVATIVPAVITDRPYQTAVYDYSDDIDDKTNSGWQKWEDLSDEYNSKVSEEEKASVFGDSAELHFKTVDAAVKFDDWLRTGRIEKQQSADELRNDTVAKQLTTNGFKVGDKVMYKGEPATIYEIDRGKPVLDTGLAPVMYELGRWEDVTPIKEKPLETKDKDFKEVDNKNGDTNLSDHIAEKEQLAKSSHSLEDYLQERAKENALGFFEERKKEDEDTLYRDDDSSSMRSVSSGNDDKLAVTTLPASTELPITEVSKSGTSVEKAVQAISELPQKVETLDGVQLNISRATRNKLKNELSKHKDNMDVVAAFSNLEDVVSNSILIEEHRDRIKVNGERKAENPSDANIEKTQRFYGAVSINGKPYRVKSTAIVFKQGNNKMHSYEITKIELLSSSIPTINSQATAPNNNSITLANLLKDVEFSYEKGRKLLDEVANNDDIEKAEQDSSKKYRLIEDVKDYVLDLFYRIVGGKSNDTRYTIGTLTAEGREYLQNLTGWDFKPVTKFVLNASDLKHIYNDHFGANEKDPSRNIALNNDDIRNIVDVISNPDRVAHFVDTEHGNRKVLYFFKEAGDGTYNLCEVSSNKKGNLTAKTYYKTKRTAAQRVMDLEQSLLPTSETYFGASPLTGAKIPNLFDMGIADNENFRRNAAENEISVNQTEVDSTKLQSDIDGLVKKMNKTLGLNIVVDDKNDLQDKNDKKAKGWFDTETGEIHLVWNNHSDMADVERTILHEAVAHKGLRELFGEKFGTFLDNVYRNAEEHIKQTIDNLVSDKGMSRHEATEEYMAGLAEDTNFEQVKHTTWWAKVKSWFADMLHKLGFENFVTAEKIGNNELRYVLWRSYENLKSGGLHGIFAKAEDIAKQQKLKVGDYAEEAVRYRDGEETGQDGEPVKPQGEAEEENFLKDYNAGDATFEEAITEGLLSVAGKHKEDIKARVQATEAIGGQLSKLNKAMRVQKKYDKATVDHIIRLARTILTNGGLDKLTHGEVKRLLSYINKSVGKEAITTQARQVLDLLTEHQLKVCRESLNQLLRIKGKKVNQQGVEVQAGLDVKGQRMLETARAGIALDIDTLEQRMAEAQEKMGSDLAVEAENASIDYEGLMIARHYHELIKDSKEEEKASVFGDSAELHFKTVDAAVKFNDWLRTGRIEKQQSADELRNDTAAKQLATNAVLDALDNAGISVEVVSDEAASEMLGRNEAKAESGNKEDLGTTDHVQFMRTGGKKKSAPETASPDNQDHSTVVSSADGAKILKSLDGEIKKYENVSSYPKTFIGDVSKALGAKRQGGASEYASFETKSGKTVTIRLSNHNAKVSTSLTMKRKASVLLLPRKKTRAFPTTATPMLRSFTTMPSSCAAPTANR